MPVRSILLRGGSCRSSASRCITWQHIPMRKRTHRVRFSFEVAFWFPAASQLSLTCPPPQGTACPHQPERQPPNFLVVGRRKPKASLCGPAHSHVPDDDTSSPEAAGYRLGGTALRNAAFTQVASCSSGPAEPALMPYSSFDSVAEHRILQGQQDWPEWRYVIHAIKESVFPGNPLGRFMHHNVAGFPTPQVMITPARRFEAVGSVVFDLRGLALGIEVVDITPGVSIAAALPGVRKLPSFPAVLNALRSRTLRCTVNDEPATAESVLAAEAEVIVFSGSLGVRASRSEPSRPLAVAPPTGPSDVSDVSQAQVRHQRPPTPPIPARPTPIVRRWGQARHVTAAMETAIRRQEEADDSVPFCTVFDPLRQFQLSQTSTCRHPSAFLAYAMSKASHLGDCLDGRILTHPLPGVPTPQACVHSIVHNDYLVLPVALGDGSFCTLSVHRRFSIFQLFEQMELRCGIPRSYRFLLQRGWLTCLINNAAVRDVMAADALLFADSARLERTPALLARESPARLEDAVPRITTDTQSVFIHRPGFAPVSISATPLPFAAVEAHCVAHHLLLNDGTLKTTCPTAAQVGQDQHLLALTFRQNQAPLDWMIVDLQHVAHPPLAQFWTAPLQLPFTVAGFADLLAGEFPTLPVIVGAFIADVDLELPQSSSQAPVVTAIGLPAEHPTTGGHTTFSTTMAIGDTTCTTTEPVNEGHGFQSSDTGCSHPSPSGAPVAIPSSSTSHGSSAADLPGLQGTRGSTGVQTAAASTSGGTQLAVSFDVLHHATVHCVPATATLAEVVALILHNSQHLAPPLAFRVMHGRFPWLPPHTHGRWRPGLLHS